MAQRRDHVPIGHAPGPRTAVAVLGVEPPQRGHGVMMGHESLKLVADLPGAMGPGQAKAPVEGLCRPEIAVTLAVPQMDDILPPQHGPPYFSPESRTLPPQGCRRGRCLALFWRQISCRSSV